MTRALAFPPERLKENPGLLKLELLRMGLNVTGPRSSDGPTSAVAFSLDDGIDLLLGESTWVTAPIASRFERPSPFFLEQAEGGGLLHIEGFPTSSIPVQLVPDSPLAGLNSPSGIPYANFATCHGTFLAISPIAECSLLRNDEGCKFCSLRTTDSQIAVEDVLEAIRRVRAQRKIGMVFLNVGLTETSDAGVRLLDPYVRAIKKSFNLLVSVDALPPKDDSWIDRTYAMGVDSLSYNLEVFGESAFKHFCPGLDRNVGRQRFLDALSYATTVFPRGAVLSHLIVGAEPLEDTRLGMEALLTRGVVPILPVFHPFRGVDLRVGMVHDSPPDTQDIAILYGDLYRRLKELRLPVEWSQPISTITTPAEGRFFTGEVGRGGLLERLIGKGPKTPSTILSDWRRALRVKEVDDSFRSSGL